MKKIILLAIGLIVLVVSGFAMFNGDAGVVAHVFNFDLGMDHITGAVSMATILPMGMGSGMSPGEKAEVLKVVRENMNFEGDGDFYDGFNDDFVCFDGSPNASFVTEATAVYRQFVMTITNTSDVAQDVLLTPGLLWDPSYGDSFKDLVKFGTITPVGAGAFGAGIPAAPMTLAGGLIANDGASIISRGYAADGSFFAIGDEIINKNPVLSGAGSPKTISEFIAFQQYNPMNLLGLKIQSNGDDGVQISNQLQILSQSPFRNLASKVLNPSTYLTQDSYQKDVVLFDTSGLTLGNQTQLQYRISPAIAEDTPRVVNITFICGAVLNTTSALAKKQGKAIRNFGGMVQKLKISRKR